MARPAEYIPKHLRAELEKPKRKQLMYAIGTEHEPDEYGMWFGPNPSEEETLEQEGHGSDDYIFEFALDGTDNPIWKWEGGRWISSF